DAHEIQIGTRPEAIRQLDRVAELVVAVDRSAQEVDAAPGFARLAEEEPGAAHHGLDPVAQTATREAGPVVQLAAGSVVVERLGQVRLPGRAQPALQAAELPEQPGRRPCPRRRSGAAPRWPAVPLTGRAGVALGPAGHRLRAGDYGQTM